MKMARWLLAAIAVVCAFGSAALGATYYVDATNGDDTKDGQSTATAWKTIAKVNSSSFAPGDQILLKRGEVWWADLGPYLSREQTGRRPVVIWQSDELTRALQSVLVVPLRPTWTGPTWQERRWWPLRQMKVSLKILLLVRSRCEPSRKRLSMCGYAPLPGPSSLSSSWPRTRPSGG